MKGELIRDITLDSSVAGDKYRCVFGNRTFLRAKYLVGTRAPSLLYPDWNLERYVGRGRIGICGGGGGILGASFVIVFWIRYQ